MRDSEFYLLRSLCFYPCFSIFPALLEKAATTVHLSTLTNCFVAHEDGSLFVAQGLSLRGLGSHPPPISMASVRHPHPRGEARRGCSGRGASEFWCKRKHLEVLARSIYIYNIYIYVVSLTALYHMYRTCHPTPCRKFH